MIDLLEWRKQNIEEQCFKLLEDYVPDLHDQGTLNAVLGDKVLLLPLEWNFMTGHFETTWAYFEGNRDSALVYTKEEYLLAQERIKIVHFLTPRKPWRGGDFEASSYRRTWWELAFQTPVFSDEFYLIYAMAFEESLIGLGRAIENQHLSKQILMITRKIKRKIKRIFRIVD